MAIAMRGLRLRPTYEQLIGVAVSDELRNIKFPNRDAKFLRDGFVLSQLDGEGMRIMEQQQQMHMKEVYKESALKSLASNAESESVVSLRTALSNNSRTQRVQEMLSRASQAAPAVEYYDISSTDEPTQDAEPPVDLTNYIHVQDYTNQIRNLQDESRLREMESYQRQQQIIENNKRMAQEELYNVAAKYEREMTNRAVLIDDLLTQVNKPPPYLYTNPATNPTLEDHLKSVATAQQARQPRPAGSSSDPAPEMEHEPRGNRGRPRASHGVPAEKRRDPIWWKNQPLGFITAQLSELGWREPKMRHLTKAGHPAKRLTKEHYLAELFALFDHIDY